MANKFITFLVAMAVSCGSATLFAQDGTKPANVGEGTLMLKGKNYPLKNAVAYETTVDGEEGIAVVLSGPTISSEKINEARKSEKRTASPLNSGDLTSSWSSPRQGSSRAGPLVPATSPWAGVAVVMRLGN